MPNQPPRRSGFEIPLFLLGFRIFSAKRRMTPRLHRRPDEIAAFLTALLGSALAAVSAETTVRLDHVASVIINADHRIDVHGCSASRTPLR